MADAFQVIETRACANCQVNFPIFARDVEFYRKLEVPFPTWCPPCRGLRRHGHVNDYVYFSRNCDQCGKKFVATFPASSPYRVICQTCWYSESRDDRAEGRDYDAARSFFDQFNELMHDAPQMGNLAINVENCDYCESIADCKNCYLISECSNCEDCYYGYWVQKSEDCLDSCYLHECQRCYECSDCFNCYALKYSSNCQNCADSYFLDNCIGCSDCIGCVNLRHKQYHIFNHPYSREEYFAERERLEFSNRGSLFTTRQAFQQFLLTQPRRHLQQELCENSSGDYIRNTKNCFSVYHCYDAEDCAHGEHIWRGAQFCMDVNTAGRGAELLYETTNTNMGAYFTKFSRYCWGCRYVEYSNMCVNSSYLFGCVGLKAGAKYCVLNQQYTEQEYFDLTKKIKARMCEDGEYGEFFPLSISLFGYNNTVSFDEYQLSESQVRAKGWKWETAQPGVVNRGDIAPESIPETVQDADSSLCGRILTCTICQRNYRIIEPELAFYRKENVPIPLCCPDCRHRNRLQARNQKRVNICVCADCGKRIETTLDHARFSRIICASCYQLAVY